MRIAAAALLALAATPAGSAEFSGVYVSGFEVSAFDPCSAAERWWLETTGEAGPGFWKRVRAVEGKGAGGRVFIYMVVDGDISEKGAHGHLGQYARRITVKSASEVRRATPGEIEACADSDYMRSLR